MNKPQSKELSLHPWEHEVAGVLVAESAVEGAVNRDLRAVWSKYLDQTRTQVKKLRRVCDASVLDARPVRWPKASCEDAA